MNIWAQEVEIRNSSIVMWKLLNTQIRGSILQLSGLRITLQLNVPHLYNKNLETSWTSLPVLVSNHSKLLWTEHRSSSGSNTHDQSWLKRFSRIWIFNHGSTTMHGWIHAWMLQHKNKDMFPVPTKHDVNSGRIDWLFLIESKVLPWFPTKKVRINKRVWGKPLSGIGLEGAQKRVLEYSINRVLRSPLSFKDH